MVVIIPLASSAPAMVGDLLSQKTLKVVGAAVGVVVLGGGGGSGCGGCGGG